MFRNNLIPQNSHLILGKIYELKYNLLFNKLIQSLFKLREQPDSILFLFEIPIQEWSNWHEVSTQSDINYVTVNDLLDIEKCIEFYLNIGKKKI